jgi:hypothetical protein
MFSALHTKLVYNSILMASVDFSINNSITTKVYYVLGQQNVIADYLSMFPNTKAFQLAPNMHICAFQPP